jgi:hypothetical protein
MVQNLNNPAPPPDVPNANGFRPGQGNSTGGSSNIALGDSNPIAGALGDAWKGFSGRNDYRAPENVFNPMDKYDPRQSLEDRANQQAASSAMGAFAGPNSYYQGLMNGATPSLAEMQMRQGIASAQRQGMQAAAGARGMDRAAAFRAAQNNASNLTAQGAIAGGQQRLQEAQLGAQGYSQGLQAQHNMMSTQRQQDVGEQQGLMGLQNNAQANLNQQYAINAGITNANAANGQKGAAGAVQLGAMALGALASDIRAKEGIVPATGSALAPGVAAKEPGFLDKLSQGLTAFGGGGGAGVSDSNAAGGAMFTGSQMAQMSGAGSSAGGGAGGAGGITESIPGLDMMSDENSKEAFRGIHPYQFKYKDGIADEMAKGAAQSAYEQAFADAKTPRMGVMAQDLAKNPETRSAVMNTQDGLAIDGKRALALMLASSADFNDRLSALEGRAS